MSTAKTLKHEKLCVLSLEDSERDFELIRELLIDAGYHLCMERVETEMEFTSSLRDKAWDVILSDFKLPGLDAFGALRIRNEICPETPFICISGTIGEECAIDLLKSGAVDYVIKDRPERLPFALEQALEKARQKRLRLKNEEALKEANQQLKKSQAEMLRVLEELKAENQARKAREAELHKVTLAVEQAGEIVMITDTDAKIQYVNPVFTAVTGYSREEVIGQNPRMLKSGHQDHAFYKNLWDTIAAGRVWEGRMVNKRKDGILFVESATISPVKDGAGESVGYVAVKQDITEREKIEAYREMSREVLQILNETGDLRESIQRILLVLKTQTGVDAVGLRLQDGEDFPYFAEIGFLPDFLQTENTLVERDKNGGVCRDKDGNISLECTCGLVISGKTDPGNPLFTKGGSCWTNNSFPILDLPADQDPRLHPRNNCIHQGYASVALIPVLAKDQIVGLIQLNDKRKGFFTPETIEILEGMAAHIGSALMRKQTEAEREKLQKQLTQAQKMESVGRLAGGVAHDFNNMLGVILGYVELLLRQISPDHTFHSDLTEIRKAAERSADLTGQLLAFARKQIIAPKVLDLNESIASTLKMLKRLIGEDVDLLWNPGYDLWPVRIDPTQIDQVLANLCVNARDAIADVGKVTIETDNIVFEEEYCKKHAGFLPREYTMIAVSDNGCGMDAETQTHLFEPFFTTKELGKGTGLGLATVYGIVMQNRGFINVCSEPGLGTTFKVYLPRYTAKAAETELLKPQAAQRGSETILLVEDESAMLKMTSIMLGRLGYAVLVASTPGEAIRLAREYAGRIDLVMTDVVMPKMNGRDLAKNLQTLHPEMKRLFMSGYAANVIAPHGVLDEGVNFIQKPFSINDLGVKLREALENLEVW